jgi:glutaconate CoA-transferase subunit B
VITDKGVLENDPATGEMILTALYPDVTVEEVKSSVGWPLRARDQLGTVRPPSQEELRLLREVLDPKKLYLG